ncbi:MAG: 50S ribosomal protein L22 [Candidatus Nealsonbacteria bacterium]|nr:50S ribosomal protein L22 [Candidatus Nealsonbacteria bacterium]
MITAKLRHLHIAPRKVRLIADLIRGKSTTEAVTILNFTTKKAALDIQNLLNSAIANAKNNFQLDPSNLYILKISVDEGPKIKRFMPRARGSANEIQKKTSHINLVLEEIEKGAGKLKATKEEEVAKDEKIEKIKKEEKPKLKPEAKIRATKSEKGAKRIFRRQVF